jgi:hypothetical protein
MSALLLAPFYSGLSSFNCQRLGKFEAMYENIVKFSTYVWHVEREQILGENSRFMRVFGWLYIHVPPYFQIFKFPKSSLFQTKQTYKWKFELWISEYFINFGGERTFCNVSKLWLNVTKMVEPIAGGVVIHEGGKVHIGRKDYSVDTWLHPYWPSNQLGCTLSPLYSTCI